MADKLTRSGNEGSFTLYTTQADANVGMTKTWLDSIKKDREEDLLKSLDDIGKVEYVESLKGELGSKPKLSLVPQSVQEGITEALENGIKKHGGSFNWRTKQLSRMEYYAKILRHVYASIDGEEVSADSQISHLHHASADLAIMIDSLKYGTLVDDRPKEA